MLRFSASRVLLPACFATCFAAWAALPAEGNDPAPGVQIVKAAALDAKIEGTPPSPGGRGGVVARAGGWRVHFAERDAPGLAELHENDTDVWYVVAGEGTLVIGGTLVDAKPTGPGEHRATAIKDGTEHTVSAGDLVTIGPGVPHWVQAVRGRLRYLTVKVLSPGDGPPAR